MIPLPPIELFKRLAIAQVLIGVFGAAGFAAVYGPASGASFLVGTLIMLTTVVSLAWIGWRVFTQKSVAWTVVGIISKYAVLLGSIYSLTRTAWFNVAAGGLGIASFVIPALVTAVLTPEKESLRGGSSF